VYRLNHEH